MNLEQLRYFVEVASKGSFAAAARELFITKNGLAYQIRQFERELGTDLFERDSHHVQITEAGATLLPTAQAMVAQWDQALRSIETNGSEARPLKVGMQHYMDPDVLDAVDRTYRNAFPASIVDPTFMYPFNPQPFVDGLLEGNLDVAFITRKEINAASLCDFVPLCPVRYGAYVEMSHRLATASEVTWSDLEGEQIVLLAGLRNPQNKTHLSTTLALFKQRCPTASVRYTNGLESMQYLVRHGSCVGILQYTSTKRIDANGCALVPIADKEDNSFGIAHLSADPDPRVVTYVHACREAFATIRNE